MLATVCLVFTIRSRSTVLRVEGGNGFRRAATAAENEFLQKFDGGRLMHAEAEQCLMAAYT